MVPIAALRALLLHFLYNSLAYFDPQQGCGGATCGEGEGSNLWVTRGKILASLYQRHRSQMAVLYDPQDLVVDFYPFYL